jgi:hypothetical protein
MEELAVVVMAVKVVLPRQPLLVKLVKQILEAAAVVLD